MLKAIWEEDKINATYKKLENLRSELILRLSVITKKNVDLVALTQDEGFRRLDQRTAIIVQRLIHAPAEFISSLNAQTLEINRRHDQSDMLAVQLQRETLSAINRLQPVSPGPSLVAKTPSPGPHRKQLNAEETRRALIEMLKFRQMFSRQDDVAVAHPDTFRWILSDEAQSRSKGAFSPLLPWLKRGEGSYWVNGKAGSGKSTLMKFLGSSIEVRHALETWACSHQLIIASFYFWRSGTLLQRSQEGLLRWLLYTILSQQPELVRTCFPDDFDKLKDGREEIAEITPTLELMKDAFNYLSRADIRAFKIFLFIDGVDEFEGDHTEILHLFRNLASNPSFKIILSSRPIPACVEAFKRFPSLCLQHLTHEDIKAYVEGTIGRHERMDLLLSENRCEASKLINIILSKASGVFLWVKLVVKSLLDGFQNYDRISDLQDRVDEFPAELGSLYLHMFRSMESRYQSHAAQLLRIVIQSIEVQQNTALTVLQLSFADEGDPSRAFSAPIRPMDEKERKARYEAMAGRIRSRCCGLIEVHGSEVQVLHKSVLDFLTEGEVWETMLSMTRKFDPNLVLIAACLFTIKTLPTEESVGGDVVTHCLRYCQLREKSTQRAQTQAVGELRRVLAIREPKQLWMLLRHICSAGLSRYVDHLLGQTSKGALKDMDIPPVIVHLVERMVMSYMGGNSPLLTFSLAEEYMYISKALLVYMVRNPSEYMAGQRFAWVGITKQIRSLHFEQEWIDSQSKINILKSLIAVVEAFLQQEADVNVTNWTWSPTSDQLSTLPPKTNPDFLVSDSLLTWLGGISDRLTDQYGEDAVLKIKIEELRNTIITRQTPLSIEKQNEWSRWLSRALPPQEAGYEPQNVRVSSATKLQPPSSVWAVPGGPFELDSAPLQRFPNIPMNQPAIRKQPLTTKPAHPRSRLSFSLSLAPQAPVQNSNNVEQRQEKPSCWVPSMSWRTWIETHYIRTFPAETRHPQPTIRAIEGLFELAVPDPGTLKPPAQVGITKPRTKLLAQDAPPAVKQKKSRMQIWKWMWM